MVNKMPDAVDVESVKRKMRFDYIKARNESDSKALEGFSTLLSHFERPQLSIRDMIQDSANFLQRQFKLRWAMVGLKSSSDGLFRYEVQTGMRTEAWARQKAKAYKETDFDPRGSYKAGEISKLSRVYLEEENPLFKEDEGVVNRPVLLRTKRKEIDDTLEADFVDTLILGSHDELLGWLEYSGTLAGKLPEPMVIRHAEVAAAILGAAIIMHERMASSPGT
jgi:hypothetical protein